MRYALFPLVILLSAAVFGQTRAARNPYDLPDGLYAEVSTPRGVVVGELYYKKVPMTVASYVGLAEGKLGPKPGAPFYDGNTFFRVVPNFVIQGGSGAAGPDGAGPGYEFPDEIVPGLRHDSVGVIQMANDGPDTNGSQWCMMTSEVNRLNYNHTVFGHVVRGLEILPQIRQGDTMRVKILRLGDEARAFKADRATFTALVNKAKRYEGPKSPGPDAWFDDPDGILPTTPARASDFNRKLGNFQRFTGQRIIGRVYARTPDEAKGDRINAYMQALAERLKVDKEGALAVYFKDTDQWHMRIAPASRAEFKAGPRKPDGSRAPIAADRNLEESIANFLDQMHKEVPRLMEIAIKATPLPAATQPMTEGQKIKFQVDSVLDNLIFRLEPDARTAR